VCGETEKQNRDRAEDGLCKADQLIFTSSILLTNRSSIFVLSTELIIRVIMLYQELPSLLEIVSIVEKKVRAAYLAGDNKTLKYFPHISNFRRNCNTGFL
jgi:hypothetical protein